MLHKAHVSQLAAAAEVVRRQNSATYSTPPSPTTSPPAQECRSSAQEEDKMAAASSMLDLTARRQRELSSTELRPAESDGSVGPPSTSSGASPFVRRNSCSSPLENSQSP